MIFAFLGLGYLVKMMFSSSIHLPENFKMSLFFYVVYYFIVQMYHIFLIHSLVEGHFGCFQVLAMTNNAAMNIAEHMFLWYNWASIGYIFKSDIAGSWRRLFSNFLRNYHTDIQRGWTSLHSHQQCRSVPFTLHSLQYKLSLVFWILAILTGVIWNLRVVLSCISLMTKNVEHFRFLCWEFFV